MSMREEMMVYGRGTRSTMSPHESGHREPESGPRRRATQQGLRAYQRGQVHVQRVEVGAPSKRYRITTGAGKRNDCIIDFSGCDALPPR